MRIHLTFIGGITSVVQTSMGLVLPAAKGSAASGQIPVSHYTSLNRVSSRIIQLDFDVPEYTVLTAFDDTINCESNLINLQKDAFANPGEATGSSADSLSYGRDNMQTGENSPTDIVFK
jgi:hypothetical protein